LCRIPKFGTLSVSTLEKNDQITYSYIYVQIQNSFGFAHNCSKNLFQFLEMWESDADAVTVYGSKGSPASPGQRGCQEPSDAGLDVPRGASLLTLVAAILR
jgi:hypothetical protein